MIPIAYITEWRQHHPWPIDSQVEQDLIISRALVDIFSSKELASQLAFRGGTALHKIYFQPPSRYSEDIDLVQMTAKPIGPTLEKLRSILDPWLGTPKREFNVGSAKLVYRINSEGAPITPLRLKIEINTREHFALDGWEKISFKIISQWFTGAADITTYTLNELLGTKFRALYQRKKGRDLFDIWLGLQNHQISMERILEIFQEYLCRNGDKVTLKTFIENLDAKMGDKKFTQDISPLLRPELSYSQATAASLLRVKLLEHWA